MSVSARRAQSRAALPSVATTTPAPRILKDPWAWLCVLAIVPLVLHSVGAPLGEPLADDFVYLKRMLLTGGGSLFDGCGWPLFWRPLGRQVYFGLLGPLILSAPGLVATLHVVALCLMTLLLYHAFRRRWPGPWAAAAASTLLFTESTRMLVAWPSHFMELGALLFLGLAVHQAAAGRMVLTLPAIVASLLCKEVAAVAALLIPWLPVPSAGPPRRRWLWTLAIAGTVLAWGLSYFAVIRYAGLATTGELYPESAVTPWTARVAWGVSLGLRAQFSLAVNPGPWDIMILALVIAIVLGALARIVVDPASRARARANLPWMGWGIVWFLVGIVPLAEVFPNWAPYRSALAGIGLGVALVAIVAPAGSWLLGALVMVRVAAFALSPGPPAGLTAAPLLSGAGSDFPRLARTEHFVRGIRTLLERRYPSLPRGARVVQHHLPQLTEYALAGDLALQVWYRDTTLRWERFETFQRHPDLPAVTIVEYQPHREGRMALVDPAAMRALFEALEQSSREEWESALAALHRADSVQSDPEAAVFLATVAAKRAWIRSILGDSAAAEREALHAYALWPDNHDSRYVLAVRRFEQGRFDEADALLDTLLAQHPDDLGGQNLRAEIARKRAGSR